MRDKMETDALREARAAYVKLLKNTEELDREQLALASESFSEGWHAYRRWAGLQEQP